MPQYNSFEFIYLASQSPRRRELLEQIGVCYEMLLPDESENAESLEELQPGESADHYVQRVTLLKWNAALDRFIHKGLPLAPILCADTTVVYQNRVYGKPLNRADAFRMIEQLQGNCHQVLTAVAVGIPQMGVLNSSPGLMLSVSHVTMSKMSDADIENYLDGHEYQGKAGAYAIQGRMGAYISHIIGSYSGIMGLPLFETAQLLKKAGFKSL